MPPVPLRLHSKITAAAHHDVPSPQGPAGFQVQAGKVDAKLLMGQPKQSKVPSLSLSSAISVFMLLWNLALDSGAPQQN